MDAVPALCSWPGGYLVVWGTERESWQSLACLHRPRKSRPEVTPKQRSTFLFSRHARFGCICAAFGRIASDFCEAPQGLPVYTCRACRATSQKIEDVLQSRTLPLPDPIRVHYLWWRSTLIQPVNCERLTHDGAPAWLQKMLGGHCYPPDAEAVPSTPCMGEPPDVRGSRRILLPRCTPIVPRQAA